MDFLLLAVMGKPLWLWLVFFALVLALLAFDLGVLHKESREIGVRESLVLSAIYVGIGTLFSLWVWHLQGAGPAMAYLTGFLVEKSLALDNIFVIATIFAYFGVPRVYQHRVLIYGILGVVVLRGIMIAAGLAVIERFDWVLLLFAVFLVFTGIKMFFVKGAEYDVASNPVLRLLWRHCRVTDTFHRERFFVRLRSGGTGRGVLFATPLFLALVMVELADVIFAVDSIPAILAITTDPYIVYTSNIFAILGLRALYFTLAALMHRFADLKYALALVLIFIGGKVIAADLLGIEKIPSWASLAVTFAILAGGFAFSFWRSRPSPAQPILNAVQTGEPAA